MSQASFSEGPPGTPMSPSLQSERSDSPVRALNRSLSRSASMMDSGSESGSVSSTEGTETSEDAREAARKTRERIEKMEQEDAPEPAVFENAIWSYQEYKDRLERLRNFPETMGYLVDNMRVTSAAARARDRTIVEQASQRQQFFATLTASRRDKFSEEAERKVHQLCRDSIRLRYEAEHEKRDHVMALQEYTGYLTTFITACKTHKRERDFQRGQQLPAAPARPVFTEVSMEFVTIEWMAPASGSGDVFKYQIGCLKVADILAKYGGNVKAIENSREEDQEELWKVLVEVGRDLGRIIQKYTLNDLEKGSTYHFRIRARNCTGWGGWGPPSEAVGAAVSKKDERRTSVIAALASGEVDWLEEVWEKISQVVAENKGNIAKIFDDFDVGGDGEVSMVELTFILREKLKLDVQDEQISLILREFDKDGDGHIQYNEFMNAIEAYNFRKSMKGLSGGKGAKSALMQTMGKFATAKKAGEDGDAGTHSERERASTDSFESDILRMEMDNWDPYLDMMQPSAIVRRNGGRESMIGVEEGGDGVKFDDEDAQPRKENDPLADMPRLEVELEIAETLAPDPIKTGMGLELDDIGRIVVTSVDKDSEAAELGVETGFHISVVNEHYLWPPAKRRLSRKYALDMLESERPLYMVLEKAVPAKRMTIIFEENTPLGLSIEASKATIPPQMFVGHVEEGSDAYALGLQPRDVIISLNDKLMEELGPKKLANMLNIRPLEMLVDRGIPIGKELLAARSTLESTPEEEQEWAAEMNARKGKKGKGRGSTEPSLAKPPVRSSVTYKSNTKSGRRGSTADGRKGSQLGRRGSMAQRGSSKSPARSASPSGPTDFVFEATLDGLRLGADIRSSMGGAAISSVEAGGPAAKLGIRPGDVIVSVGNKDYGATRKLHRTVFAKDLKNAKRPTTLRVKSTRKQAETEPASKYKGSPAIDTSIKDGGGGGSGDRRLSFEDEKSVKPSKTDKTKNVVEEKIMTKTVTVVFTETGGPKQLGFDLALQDGMIHVIDVKAYSPSQIKGVKRQDKIVGIKTDVDVAPLELKPGTTSAKQLTKTIKSAARPLNLIIERTFTNISRPSTSVDGGTSLSESPEEPSSPTSPHEREEPDGEEEGEAKADNKVVGTEKEEGEEPPPPPPPPPDPPPPPPPPPGPPPPPPPPLGGPRLVDSFDVDTDTVTDTQSLRSNEDEVMGGPMAPAGAEEVGEQMGGGANHMGMDMGADMGMDQQPQSEAGDGSEGRAVSQMQQKQMEAKARAAMVKEAKVREQEAQFKAEMDAFKAAQAMEEEQANTKPNSVTEQLMQQAIAQAQTQGPPPPATNPDPHEHGTVVDHTPVGEINGATSVLVLLNMISEEQLHNDAEYADILAEIREECEAFGVVEEVYIPRAHHGDLQGIGKIYVDFLTKHDATMASHELAGRHFDGQIIQAAFLDEADFDSHQLDNHGQPHA